MSTHCPSVPPLSVQFSPVWRVLSAILLLLLLLLLTVRGKQQVLDQATTIRWSSTGTGTGTGRGRGSSSCSQVLLSVMKIACSRSERLRGGKRVSTVGQGGCGVQSHTSDPLERGDIGAGSQMPFDRHKLPIGASCLNWRWANGKWEGVQGGEKREGEGGLRCCHATRSRTLLANRI